MARPRKQNARDEGDDEPTYVDEHTHDTLTKDEYAALLMDSKDKVHEDQTSSSLAMGAPSGEELAERTSEHLEDAKPAEERQANIGSNCKKRRVTVILDDYEGPERVPADDGAAPEIVNRNAKKKRKKIKLSFEEEVAVGPSESVDKTELLAE